MTLTINWARLFQSCKEVFKERPNVFRVIIVAILDQEPQHTKDLHGLRSLQGIKNAQTSMIN